MDIWPTSRPHRREVGCALLVGLALAVVTTWPLAWRIGEIVPGDLGDPLLQTWQLAWAGHAWLPGGAPLWDTNAWYPLTDTSAFSDPTVGYAPLAMAVATLAQALTRYTLAFFVALTLAWAGPYLLARELGAGRVAAAVAGGAAAYAPWRLAHDGHLNVLSSGGIALALWLLVRGYRERRSRLVLAGWGVAAWQLSVTLSLGVPFGTFLGVLVLVAAVGWWRRGRPALGRPIWLATLGGLVVFVGAIARRAAPYLRVADAHADAVRTVGHLVVYSPPPTGLLAAPESSLVWGSITAPLRNSLRYAPEQTLHVGLVVVALALTGLVATRWPRSLRLGLAATVVVTGLLALGVSVAGGHFTYLPLFDLVPGWNGMRTPGRVIAFTSLGLGLLGALGLERVRTAVAGRASDRIAHGVAVILVVLVHVEGLGATELAAPPPPPPIDAPAPRLHLPSGEVLDGTYLFWSIADGFPPVVNGTGSFVPEVLHDVRLATHTFPDQSSVALLRSLGVRSVVWHAQRAEGTPWQDVGARSPTALGVTRRVQDDTVVFDLGPPDT